MSRMATVTVPHGSPAVRFPRSPLPILSSEHRGLPRQPRPGLPAVRTRHRDSKSMTTAPPDTVSHDLTRLAASLDAELPGGGALSLLVATWNIRAFGDLTAKWAAGPRDTPERDRHAVAHIADVLSRFDVIAIQEARRLLRDLPVSSRSWFSSYTSPGARRVWGQSLTPVSDEVQRRFRRLTRYMMVF